MSLGVHVPVDSKSSEFAVKVSGGIIFFQHQNWLSTSDGATLHFYFPLAVSGSIGDEFGFTNLKRYSSKSQFYDVFRQDKCPSLDFKRIFICFDPRKTLINCFASGTFHWIVQRFVMKDFKILYINRNFKASKFINTEF